MDLRSCRLTLSEGWVGIRCNFCLDILSKRRRTSSDHVSCQSRRGIKMLCTCTRRVASHSWPTAKALPVVTNQARIIRFRAMIYRRKNKIKNYRRNNKKNKMKKEMKHVHQVFMWMLCTLPCFRERKREEGTQGPS